MKGTAGLEAVLSPLLTGLGLKPVGRDEGEVRWESAAYVVTARLGRVPGVHIGSRVNQSDVFVPIPTLSDLAAVDSDEVQGRLDSVGSMFESLLADGLGEPAPGKQAPQQFQVRAPPELVPLAHEAGRLLSAFTRPGPTSVAVAAQLRPQDDDYFEVFAPEAAEAARAAYTRIWSSDPVPHARADQTRVEVVAAHASEILVAVPNGFPGGYERIAHLLNPNRVWMSWRYTAPGQSSGMAFDGMVALEEGRWAWFPKPYRAFRSII